MNRQWIVTWTIFYVKDDRLETIGHLRGVRFQRSRYKQPSQTWDHDHCAVCWVKFTELPDADNQTEGYTTCDDYKHGANYEWVCSECYKKFADEMGWWPRVLT